MHPVLCHRITSSRGLCAQLPLRVYTVDNRSGDNVMTTLAGRKALITGAGRRLGRIFAEGLAAQGVDLAVHYGRSAEGAVEVVGHAHELGVHATAIQADLNDPAAVETLFTQSRDALGAIDILINNAAIFEPINLTDTTLDVWQRHLAINLTAPFLLTREFARQGTPGDIINILDWRALRPGADHFAYTIAKAALAALTQSAAQAAAPDVRVNGIALGAILPPPGEEDYDDAVIQDVPAGRWGSTEETLDTLLMLLTSPGYITGEIIHLDGGRHLV